MPESRTTRLPNFIVAGAPTCGTTSLYYYLRQHPQIYMSPVKEPTFFAATDMLAREDFSRVIRRDQNALKAYLDGPQVRSARYWVTEWADYVRLFRDAGDQIAIGEASVSYIWLPGAAARIRDKLPQARLIFLLRDPADRLFSWYLMTLKQDPLTPLRTRLLQEMRKGADESVGLLRQLDGGLYATHLKRFLALFPKEQIRIYLYDHLRTDAQSVLRDIFVFLGVSAEPSINLSQRHNATMVPRFPALHGLRRRLLGDASVIGWLPTSAKLALSEIYNRPRGRLSMDPEDRRLVIDFYRDEILRTQDLIGHDLSAWLR